MTSEIHSATEPSAMQYRCS